MANTPETLKPRDEKQTTGTSMQGSESRNRPQEGRTSEQAKGIMSTAVDKTKELASSAGQTAGSVASTVGQKAEDATAAVGSGMKSLAGTIREKGPHDGFTGQTTAAVADALETSGRYLEEEGLRGMGQDVTHFIRRYPIPALLVGVGLGLLIARATRS